MQRLIENVIVLSESQLAFACLYVILPWVPDKLNIYYKIMLHSLNKMKDPVFGITLVIFTTHIVTKVDKGTFN